jgi:hypothetical protein
MPFRDDEKKRLVTLKSHLFSSSAQPNGYYSKTKQNYDFCLQEDCADENLYESFRTAAIKYFTDRNIPWHDGKKPNPSNHLCCSQSACINALFPFHNEPLLLKKILLELGYPVKEVLPFSEDKTKEDVADSYIAFEWIGNKNYLKELEYGKIANDKNRSRGKGFTSADFAILFKRVDHRIQLILGEWKYTEEYKGRESMRFSKNKDGKNKTDRLEKIYKPFLLTNSPINISPYTDYSILFFDPFDQLMRLQLLAKQMELSIIKELNADIVSIIHIAPKANKDLMHCIPSDELKSFGTNIHNVWMNIVEPEKFKGLNTETLIDIITNPANSVDNKWADYIKTRYSF